MALPPDRPPPTVARQLKAAGILLLIVVVLVGGAYGVLRISVGRAILEGEHDHDFGLVELAGEAVLLRHDFALTNRSSRPIEITRVNTSCRCTVAALATPRTIAPGETLEVGTSFNITSDGHKEARVSLLCGDDGVETLHLRAVARNRQRLVLPRGGGTLAPGASVKRTLIFYDYDTNDTPPPPEITVAEGVGVQIGDWTIQTRRSSAKGLPARWSAPMIVTQNADELPQGATLALEVPPGQRVSVALATLGVPPAIVPGTPPG